MKPSLSVLTACLLLGACSQTPPRDENPVLAPAAWQSPHAQASQLSRQQWWSQFGSPPLDRLIAQARVGSYDLAAAVARVQQAHATAVIAGAPLLPEVKFGGSANREKLLRGKGYSQLDATDDNKAVDYFDANLTASYEVDFWGGKAAARDSALHALKASEFDQATVELTLLSGVATQYVQTLAFDEQLRIARLNLANAQRVLHVVQTRYDAGSATALELAQQKSLVAAQQRQLPLVAQQAQEARITLAVLLGEPVQNITLGDTTFAQLHWPGIGSGVPSELLSQRPDIANAEAKLAAASADITVARAAMLPSLTLSATLGSGADRLSDVLRSPFYSLTAGLAAPIFNNGRLSGERDKATARQQELLQTYRGSIISAFADVEKALNSASGLDQQRQWQDEELKQAQHAFDIAQSRYQAGAEVLLTVLETQRTLYQAQDQNVQLRLARLQASIALYKALGGGWRVQ
ncbi:efflux transporter outer membrane subunit [Pseudomonas sp. CCC3.1]|uniref:efflux transporter outer membrane subunit n=1 Tax=Pseudomonas sp. CCC3.1 TaxID=3048607 RepID=UPI002AC91E2A|nr:efflux transporter outer membrane subunit [Pseudomonas sp. CCC3.1]MEB0204510.1 efflux transporter outer membrane subunit [Pseudomonas sp. CCC3.1]WPX38029.1 efflux transporter outer membrane subunit [Pseudomonas sp. CCC3.1]